ncbi:MAG: hypothetical protein ACFFAU_16875 [Candidatus Hodarchaeota archaeon]
MKEKINLKTKLLFSFLLIIILAETTGVFATTNTITRLEAMNLGVVWEKVYGGTARDWGSSVINTSDGGFAILATTKSFGEGAQDFWLLKTDVNGNLQWNKTYGGTGDDNGFAVFQTADNGFAMLGHSNSVGNGLNDFWIVKTDSQGNHQWNNSYGGTENEIFRSAVSTLDGAFVLTGATWSYGSGDQDIWLLKVNSTGQAEWNRTLGGLGEQRGLSVVQTTDAGFAISGGTGIYKTNSTGHQEWNNVFGTAGHDFFNNIIQTSDGGYLLSGGSDLHGAVGENDLILAKLLGNGTVDWIKTYGGLLKDYSCCDKASTETSNGDFLFTGQTYSYGDGTNGDLWVLKTDSSGNELWNKALGGSSTDTGRAILLNDDGTFMLIGETESKGNGLGDLWLIKANETTVATTTSSYSGFQIGEITLISSIGIIITILFRKKGKA